MRLRKSSRSTLVNIYAEDQIIWKCDVSGKVTRSKVYRVLLNHLGIKNSSNESSCFPGQTFWALKAPHRLLVLIWRVKLKALQCADILRSHHLQRKEGYVLCGLPTEITYHVFLHCHFVRSIWFGTDLTLRPQHDNRKRSRIGLMFGLRVERHLCQQYLPLCLDGGNIVSTLLSVIERGKDVRGWSQAEWRPTAVSTRNSINGRVWMFCWEMITEMGSFLIAKALSNNRHKFCLIRRRGRKAHENTLLIF